MTATTNERFTSLDIFRGLTICFMIIVNTPGNGATTFWPLIHADWNGFTPTDLVFPSFLFAMGNALSFVSRRWESMSTGAVVWKILKRTGIIFLLGYLMYWFPFFRLDANAHITSFPISETRIMGVLQRIALTYGIVALMLYFFKKKATVLIGILALFVYWAALYVFGTPGDELSKTGNAVLYFDKIILGANHLYTGEGFPFDPEGLLSTLPALFNVIAGYLAGAYLQKKGKNYEAITRLLLSGIGLLIAAYIWNDFLPVNKKLWTGSYAVLTVGLDLIIIAFIVYLHDIKSWTKGSNFFVITGKNPLFIYLMSELGATVMWMIHIGKEPLYSWLFKNIFSIPGNYIGSLLFAVDWMLTCWLAGYILDRNRIYIKI